MAFIPFASTVAKIELFFRQDGQQCENVLHFRLPSSVTEASLTTLCEDVIAWWDTLMQPIVTSKVDLVGVKGTALGAVDGPAVEVVDGLPLSGTASSASLPNNVTVVIKFLTAKRGRSFRGRLYHVGLYDTLVVDSHITSAAQSALQAAYAALLSEAGFGGALLVVASRVADGEPRTLGITTEVTGVAVNEIIDSQRRRLPERGA